MPNYQYKCDCGLKWEQRAGYEDGALLCGRCGRWAKREQVYRDQYMSAETGPKGGTRSEPPREEKSYRKQYSEFREASQEIEHAYSRVDDPAVKPPSYYKEGLKQAKKKGAKIASN